MIRIGPGSREHLSDFVEAKELASRMNTGASIARIVKNFSLEMTGKDIPSLEKAKGVIPQGTRVNVTFLGNEELEMRIAAAKAVKDCGFVPVPHISARRMASVAQLEEFLGRLQEIGASEKVFVVGGDPSSPEGPFADSLSVIRTGLLSEYGVKEVSIAGYPEGHTDISPAVLSQHLEYKVRAPAAQGLAAIIITQFGFDVSAVVTWMRAVRERGIESESRIGTAGPAGVKRLMAFATRFGGRSNAMIVRKYGFSLKNLLGTAGPDRFVADLNRELAGNPVYGNVRLHFYAFGGILPTAEWAQHSMTSRVDKGLTHNLEGI